MCLAPSLPGSRHCLAPSACSCPIERLTFVQRSNASSLKQHCPSGPIAKSEDPRFDPMSNAGMPWFAMASFWKPCRIRTSTNPPGSSGTPEPPRITLNAAADDAWARLADAVSLPDEAAFCGLLHPFPIVQT